MIYVIATVHIRPDALEAYATLAQPLIAAARHEPGCIRYDLGASLTDPQSLIFLQQWQTREALTVHIGSPHAVAFREAIKPFITDATLEIIHPERVEVM